MDFEKVNLPDGISLQSLESLMDNAVHDEEAQACAEGPYSGHSREALEAIVDDAFDDLLEKVRNPMSHKLLALKIINHFILWHETVARNHIKASSNKEERVSGLGWAEDMGKLKVAFEALRICNLGSDDFTCGDNGE